MSYMNHPVVRVPLEKGQKTLGYLKDKHLLDPKREIETTPDELIIPVTDEDEANDFVERAEPRKKRKTPYQKIKEGANIPEELKNLMPERYERVGDVLFIKLPSELMDHKEEIGKAYVGVLDMRSVLLQGDIKGQKRIPEVEFIYGDDGETVHLENGVKYKLDASKLMFSSGNIDERVRAAGWNMEDEVIVDMFAGIGYFSLPVAVHGTPEKIYSLEINPISFKYLKENINLNDVSDTIEPWNGDNRDFPRSNIADRIVMGYLHETWKFLPKALDLLDGRGIIHYHSLCKDSEFPDKLEKELDDNIDKDHEVMEHRKIKSYAPHVFHTVSDIEIS